MLDIILISLLSPLSVVIVLLFVPKEILDTDPLPLELYIYLLILFFTPAVVILCRTIFG